MQCCKNPPSIRLGPFRIGPAPQPKPEPKPEPKSEPEPEPKSEPEPEPEPQPEPKPVLEPIQRPFSSTNQCQAHWTPVNNAVGKDT